MESERALLLVCHLFNLNRNPSLHSLVLPLPLNVLARLGHWGAQLAIGSVELRLLGVRRWLALGGEV